MIEIRDLCFSYPDGTPGLENISLVVSKGERLAVIGPNGAGKSTLLLHLNGVLRGNGVVRVMGKEVEKKTLRWVRSRVGMVFQDPNDQLFMPAVEEDVAFGPLNMGIDPREAADRVQTVLTRLGIAGLSGRNPARMSLGERKRAALATVLVMTPEILVMDEPVAGLDPGTRREFIRLVRNSADTLILSTHDLELARDLCPRVLLMDAGRIIMQGPADAVMMRSDLMRAHGLETPLSLRLKSAGR